MRPTTEIWLVNYATNANHAGVPAALPNLAALDGWNVI